MVRTVLSPSAGHPPAVTQGSQYHYMADKSRSYLPLSLRLQLYGKVLHLREQGLTYNKIIERIYRTNGVRLYTSIIGFWVRGTKSPLGNVNKFEARPSPSLAYIIGVRVGDGYIYRHGRGYIVELTVVDYEFAAETGQRLAELLGRKKPYMPKWNNSLRSWRVTSCSVLLYRFLELPLEKLKTYIEHCRHCVAAFIKAIFDGEGSIKGGRLTVYNTDKQLLVYIERLLRRHFGIKTKGPLRATKAGTRLRDPRTGKIYKAKKNCYYLSVSGPSLMLFHRYVGFTIKRKQRRLIEATQK